MFDSLTLPSVAPRWKLTGVAGHHTDSLLALLIGAGLEAKCITAGTAYRLNGPAPLLQAVADELQPYEAEGFRLEPEQPPRDPVVSLSSMVAPTPAYRRSIIVHGSANARAVVARAVDRSLVVTPAGVGRWAVTGRTSALVEWLAATCGQTRAEILAAHGWDDASVAAEDSPVSPLKVAVELPTRRVETTYMGRDAEGYLLSHST